MPVSTLPNDAHGPRCGGCSGHAGHFIKNGRLWLWCGKCKRRWRWHSDTPTALFNFAPAAEHFENVISQWPDATPEGWEDRVGPDWRPERTRSLSTIVFADDRTNDFYGFQSPDPNVAPPLPGQPAIVRLRSIAALGDILYSCSIAAAIKKQQPGSTVVLETASPELADGNPYIDRTVQPGANFEPGERLIDLRMELEWKPRKHRLVHLAEMAGVPAGDVEFFMRSEPWPGLPDKYIALHIGPTGVADWKGRNWLPERWHALAEQLSRDGTIIVAVGSDTSVSLPDSVIDLRAKTNVHQTAGIIERAHTFVGIESFPAIAAQGFGVPCVLFYGSILPGLRVFRDNVSAVRDGRLACLGCHHKAPKPAITTVCHVGGEPCQSGVSIEQFATAVRDAMQCHDGRRSKAVVIPDGWTELVYDYSNGMAYQSDRTKSVEYGQDYFQKYRRMEDSAVAKALNDFRTSLAMKYGWKVLDIGIGSGEFVRKANMAVLGFDINPQAIEWLEARGQFCDPYTAGGIPSDVAVVTMWDVLEHLPDPDSLLSRIRSGCRLLVSIPIFESLADIKRSKHYRPNEHYWYFTRDGLMKFMDEREFHCVEVLDDETRCGRESILTFVFVKRAKDVATTNCGEPQVESEEVVSGEELVRSKPVTVEELGGWDRVIHFCLPSGIGDISWVYSKICHLKAITGREILVSCPGDSNPKRGASFIELLPEVHWGGYLSEIGNWTVVSQGIPSQWPRINGTFELLCVPVVHRAAMNFHLEMGNRIEKWLPWCPINHHYPLRIPEADAAEAESLVAGSERPVFIVYCSKNNDKVVGGGWNLWNDQEWADIIVRIGMLPPCSDATFLFVGAEYDRPKTEAIANAVEQAGVKVKRCIGRPLGVTLSCMQRSHFMFSYPSGLGIMANVLRLPCLMLLPWMLRDMPETWGDPTDIEHQRYKVCVAPKVDEAFDWFRRVGIYQSLHWVRP